MRVVQRIIRKYKFYFTFQILVNLINIYRTEPLHHYILYWMAVSSFRPTKLVFSDTWKEYAIDKGITMLCISIYCFIILNYGYRNLCNGKTNDEAILVTIGLCVSTMLLFDTIFASLIWSRCIRIEIWYLCSYFQ